MRKVYAVSSLQYKEMDLLVDQEATFLLERESYVNTSDKEGAADDRPYQVINGIALYSVKGKMLSSGNIFTRFFGVATYDDITDALSQMAQDDEVVKILASVDTPGGSVSGLSDVAEAWGRVNAIKPITVHAPGTLASAGVWLTSPSTKIIASETADVGSIGVIMQHVSYEKQLDREGIKVTEIKSSSKKAIGSPAKDLSEADIIYLEKKVLESNGLFQKQIFTNRPKIVGEAMTGETFSASESLRLGLIDGISSYSKVFEQLSASADSDNQNSYTEVYGMKRKVTAAMAEAAITAGANPDNLEVISQKEFEALTPEEPTEKTALELLNEKLEAASDEDKEGILAEIAALETTDEGGDESTAVTDAQVAVLEGELAVALAQVDTLNQELVDVKAQLAASDDSPLRKFAEDRMSTMRIALNLTAVDFTGFEMGSFITEYSAVDAMFKKNFSAGGHKPKVKDASDPKPQKSNVTSLDQARFAATGLK